ncbi:MAG: hypothetical protein ABFQ89_06745 [Chloroflexota bacterium]
MKHASAKIARMEKRWQAYRDPLSVVVGAAAVGLVLSRAVELPPRQLGISVLGSALGVNINAPLIFTIAVALLVLVGSRSMYQQHPRYDDRGRYALLHLILPVMVSVTIGVLTVSIEDIKIWALAELAGISLLGGTIWNEFRILDPVERERPIRKWLALLTGYGVLLMILTVIRQGGLRTLVAMPLMFVVTTIVGVRLLYPAVDEVEDAVLIRRRRLLILSAVVGMMVTELGWVLRFSALGAASGAVLLLVVFAVAVGLIQKGITRSPIERRELIEYGLVSAAIVIAVLLR